jgi:hypothetical protein
MGMGKSIEETLSVMSQMRPIDLVLNVLASNMMIGALLGVPLAAFAKRDTREQPQS